jgi:hypothetical protein
MRRAGCADSDGGGLGGSSVFSPPARSASDAPGSPAATIRALQDMRTLLRCFRHCCTLCMQRMHALMRCVQPVFIAPGLALQLRWTRLHTDIGLLGTRLSETLHAPCWGRPGSWWMRERRAWRVCRSCESAGGRVASSGVLVRRWWARRWPWHEVSHHHGRLWAKTGRHASRWLRRVSLQIAQVYPPFGCRFVLGRGWARCRHVHIRGLTTKPQPLSLLTYTLTQISLGGVAVWCYERLCCRIRTAIAPDRERP